MEEINFEIDDCCSNVNHYLISRREDPPLETMSKASIVDKYLSRSVHDKSLTEGISDLANQLNKISIKIHQNNEKNKRYQKTFLKEKHAKAEIPERLRSITLNFHFSQERNVDSNQPQILIFWNNGNREKENKKRRGTNKSNKKRRGKEEYILSNTSGVYQDQNEILRRGMMYEKDHHYPESTEYEDISIVLNK